VNSQEDAVAFLATWFQDRGLSSDILVADQRKRKNSFLGLVSTVGSGKPPFFLLTACLDTASIGSREAWNFDPFSGHLDSNGWVHGRGAADSKAGVAIFSHLMADLSSAQLKGTVVFLADSDEHSGRFGAIKSVAGDRMESKFTGAYIGYPGCKNINVGARGFYRIRLRFLGKAAHSGSRSRNADDANNHAIRFCSDLLEQKSQVEGQVDRFGMQPKFTITQVAGGSASYSLSSDSCVVRVDVRLTTDFQKSDARAFIRRILNERNEGSDRVRVEEPQSWPAYAIPEGSLLVQSLLNGAREAGFDTIEPQITGPSNVGNFLAALGIDAVCGFGPDYESIHAPNERVDTKLFVPVYQSYRSALLKLLS
jgi:succinyl-diaminopimelate desuccinylase